MGVGEHSSVISNKHAFLESHRLGRGALAVAIERALTRTAAGQRSDNSKLT